ncbi:type II toxin-antitoxin system VapC family toxin [Streptomyces sp. SS07]|uniref:type II toxin-antitoxin system VapC family toxin n=1 Tax=Streptomyces sp. SS07 TaxID=2015315 RepID=UPI0011811C63|nr:type II toxin-antitoxin system VapC family toxin [Streptomyces sp. SS07]
MKNVVLSQFRVVLLGMSTGRVSVSVSFSATTVMKCVTIPRSLASEVEARIGNRGFSRFVSEAVEYALSLTGTREIVEAYEDEQSSFTPEEYAAAISTVSIAEVSRTGKAADYLRWLRSRLTVIPATEMVADRAANLLEDTGLGGHDNVVDALVVASTAPAPMDR